MQYFDKIIIPYKLNFHYINEISISSDSNKSFLSNFYYIFSIFSYAYI